MDELAEAKNLIKQLEEKIRWLECDIKGKTEMIDEIKNNMSCEYVENWSFTDSNGKKGRFSGNMNWIKSSGMVFYEDKTIFEGGWYYNGDIDYGELRGIYNDKLIAKWEDGDEIEPEEEEENNSERRR